MITATRVVSDNPPSPGARRGAQRVAGGKRSAATGGAVSEIGGAPERRQRGVTVLLKQGGVQTEMCGWLPLSPFQAAPSGV